MPLKMYYKKSDSPEFWNEHWKKTLKGAYLGEYYSKHLHNRTLMPIFEKYLSKEGKIIEGGCGLAPWVYVLREKGHDIEGIDNAKETINFIKSQYPDLPVNIGDIFNLDYPDNSIKGYISLGVVEHFEDGPQEIFKEAYRVLDDGSVFICSVPYFNPLRRIKKKLGLYKQKGEFYQYAFTKRDVEEHLLEAGFEIVNIYYYDAVKGFKDEVGILKPIILKIRAKENGMPRDTHVNERNKSKKRQGLNRIINYFLELRYNRNLCRVLGHMIMVVAVPRKEI